MKSLIVERGIIVTEEERIFKSYQRGLLRRLNAQKEALQSKDYETAEKIIDGLIEDTKADIED